MNTSNKLWYLVIIDDKNILVGTSIRSIIRFFVDKFKYKYALINDIEGSSTISIMNDIYDLEDVTIDVEKLFDYLAYIKQLDWGNFFFFKDFPSNWSDSGSLDYPILIVQADLTLRCVDDQYFYIYTASEEVINEVKNAYVIEEIISGKPEELDYPS